MQVAVAATMQGGRRCAYTAAQPQSMATGPVGRNLLRVVWRGKGELETGSAGWMRGCNVDNLVGRVEESANSSSDQQRGSAGRQKEATSQQPSSLSGWMAAEAKLRELGPKQPMNHSSCPNA